MTQGLGRNVRHIPLDVGGTRVRRQFQRFVMVGGPVNLFIAETSRGMEKPLLLLPQLGVFLRRRRRRGRQEPVGMGTGPEDHERRRA